MAMDIGHATKMSEAALIRVQSHYSIDIVADRYIKLYEQLLREKGG